MAIFEANTGLAAGAIGGAYKAKAQAIPNPLPTSPQSIGTVMRAGYENGKHLLNIIERVRDIADCLCGDIPRPASGGDAGELGIGLVRQMSQLFCAESEALSDLDSELSRIEAALGTDRLGVTPTPERT
jgi:hypothetical protein